MWETDTTLDYTTDAIESTTIGVTHRTYINGLKDGTLTANMHMDTAGMVAMQAANDAAAPITYVMRPGELGVADAGQYAGDFIITDMSIAGAADDNWSISLSGQLTGIPAYTAPV